MTTGRQGLRERKKQATRKALRTAALRLALERGPENVRVDDIAEAAGVSPRTYNNYFSSREQAIVAAVTAERESRVAAALLARSHDVSLSAAVMDAVVEQYTDPGEQARDALLMITTSPALRASYVDSAGMTEGPLVAALVERSQGMDRLTAQVLAASVGAAVKVALREWLQSPTMPTMSPADGGIVVPSGSLADLIRTALTPLAPGLDAAENSRAKGRKSVHPSGAGSSQSRA